MKNSNKFHRYLGIGVLSFLALTGTGTYMLLTNDQSEKASTELALPTENSFTQKDIEKIKASITDISPAASVVTYNNATLSFSGNEKEYEEYKKTTNTMNANDELKYSEVNYTELTKKALESDTKSLKGTETYLNYFERNSKYQNKNYEIKDHLLNKYKANLAVYNHNPIYYDYMLEQDETSYFVFAYSPTCLYTNNFVKDTLQYYIDSTHSLPVYTLNLDILENKEILADYNVRGTPSLLYINKGKVEKITTGVTSFGYLHNYEKNHKEQIKKK